MLLITGCGRSGTSAVAKMVHEAGVEVGHDLIPADDSNAEGYYEERRLVEINDAILTACGLGEWFATATRRQLLDAAHVYGEEMQALVAEATSAWKDPRFCLTLEAWMELLPDRPRLIVCLRSPGEVAASTMRYYGQIGDEPRRAVEHVWRTEYERLLELIDEFSLESISIEFNALHGDPSRAVKQLARFTGLPLDASSVRRDLRHHVAEVTPDLRPLYERVLSLGR